MLARFRLSASAPKAFSLVWHQIQYHLRTSTAPSISTTKPYSNHDVQTPRGIYTHETPPDRITILPRLSSAPLFGNPLPPPHLLFLPTFTTRNPLLPFLPRPLQHRTLPPLHHSPSHLPSAPTNHKIHHQNLPPKHQMGDTRDMS